MFIVALILFLFHGIFLADVANGIAVKFAGIRGSNKTQ